MLTFDLPQPGGGAGHAEGIESGGAGQQSSLGPSFPPPQLNRLLQDSQRIFHDFLQDLSHSFHHNLPVRQALGGGESRYLVNIFYFILFQVSFHGAEDHLVIDAGIGELLFSLCHGYLVLRYGVYLPVNLIRHPAVRHSLVIAQDFLPCHHRILLMLILQFLVLTIFEFSFVFLLFWQ